MDGVILQFLGLGLGQRVGGLPGGNPGVFGVVHPGSVIPRSATPASLWRTVCFVCLLQTIVHPLIETTGNQLAPGWCLAVAGLSAR